MRGTRNVHGAIWSIPDKFKGQVTKLTTAEFDFDSNVKSTIYVLLILRVRVIIFFLLDICFRLLKWRPVIVETVINNLLEYSVAF